jgi:hypothetical protein
LQNIVTFDPYLKPNKQIKNLLCCYSSAGFVNAQYYKGKGDVKGHGITLAEREAPGSMYLSDLGLWREHLDGLSLTPLRRQVHLL